MENILQSKEAKNYVKYAKRIGMLTQLKLPIDTYLQEKYDDALYSYQQYLHENNVPELKKLWTYNANNKKTWLYLSISIHDKKYMGEVLNSDFIYSNIYKESRYGQIERQRQ